MQIIFRNSFDQQHDGCTIGGPTFFSFSNIYILKLENNVVAPFRPKLYRRHVDDMFNKGKLNTNEILFEQMNNC